MSAAASGTVPGCAGASTARPVKWLTSAMSVFGAITSTAPTQAASAPQPAGQTSPQSASAAASAAGSAPITGMSVPSSESSPSATCAATSSSGSTSIAASSASAIGRSKCEPSFGRSAGERLTVIRFAGSASPMAVIAARTRSLRLAHRLVGQPDEVERRQAGGDGALHLHEPRLHALKCHRIGARDHVPARIPPPPPFAADPCVSVNRTAPARLMRGANAAP